MVFLMRDLAVCTVTIERERLILITSRQKPIFTELYNLALSDVHQLHVSVDMLYVWAALYWLIRHSRRCTATSHILQISKALQPIRWRSTALRITASFVILPKRDCQKKQSSTAYRPRGPSSTTTCFGWLIRPSSGRKKRILRRGPPIYWQKVWYFGILVNIPNSGKIIFIKEDKLNKNWYVLNKFFTLL
jgi:hypothetical protein